MRIPADSAIHLWEGCLDLHPDEVTACAECLGSDESQRANRFRFPLHRNRFIAGRGFLRRILARYLSCQPAEVRFVCSEFGKPSLDLPPGLHFNVAHSDDLFLLAVSSHPVGIDIEKLRKEAGDLEVESLREHVFSGAEQASWPTVPEADRVRAFLGMWTRKEALLKGLGFGIAHHVKNVSVFFNEHAPIVIPSELSAAPWHVQTWFGENQISSLATPLVKPVVERFQVEEELRTLAPPRNSASLSATGDISRTRGLRK